MPPAPLPLAIDRERTVDPVLAVSSCVCDLAGLACVLPIFGCAPCYTCACTPYSGVIVPPSIGGVGTDRWYRAAVFAIHGGSLCQLLATQSVFWRFAPSPSDPSRLKVEVSPRNACGKCFAPVVRSAAPEFRIVNLGNRVWSVRLDQDNPCTGSRQSCDGSSLNDVWRVSDDGAVITSMKTRGHEVTPCGLCVSTCATGPALFVAADAEVTADDIAHALRLKH